MTVSLKHKFQSARPDNANTSLVRASNWNDEHDLTLAASRLLGRATASAGAAEEITLGNGLQFSGTSLIANTGQIVTAATVKTALGNVDAWTETTVHAATAKTTIIDADELAFWDSVSTDLRKITGANFWEQVKWRAKGIGELYLVDTSNAGTDIPPSSTTDTVWIELTAGLTGVGAFNESKLTGETVSGSAPLVLATAVISVSGSPMNGQTIDLLNTENRILRPSLTPGAKQNDALQNLTGQFRVAASISSVTGVFDFNDGTSSRASSDNTNAPTVTFDASRIARTSTETRMKNVGVKAYMRVK